MNRLATILALLAALVAGRHALGAGPDPEAVCHDQAPWGMPAFDGGVAGTILCRPDAFIVLHDDEAHEPRVVVYRLTGPHSFGCVDRAAFPFYQDELLAGADGVNPGARPADYRGSGYDLGHMAPAQDGAWSATVMAEFFSMANIAPQLPGLNRQEWERLEEWVRAAAWSHGALIVMVGPVLGDHAKRIGKTGVAVPSAFFKIVVDPDTGDAIAFMMPQHAEAKGDLAPWVVSIADVEAAAHVRFKLPASVARAAKADLWAADLTGWRQHHRATCSR